jgi:hypothetical protein
MKSETMSTAAAEKRTLNKPTTTAKPEKKAVAALGQAGVTRSMLPARSALLICTVVGIADGDTLTARCDSGTAARTLQVRLAGEERSGRAM